MRALTMLFAILLTHGAQAAGDVERGKILGYTCMGCHGIEGYRNAYPSYHVPKLGGQESDYIAASLSAYRAGNRPHPTMRAQGGSLSDQDIDDLAAYFGSFGVAEDSADAAAIAGQDAAAVCITCHGTAGRDVVPTPPVLSGQHEDYLVRTLTHYRDGVRTGNVMAAFAAALTDADIAALANFYAQQEGLYTPVDKK